MRRSFIFALFLNLIAGATLLADPPSPATQPAKDQSVIMTYDVSDLLQNMQDYPLSTSSLPDIGGGAASPPGAGGGGQGLFGSNGQPISEAPPVRGAITGEAIIATIKQMVPQDEIDISKLGTMLVIRASGDTHGKIQSMLNSMHSQQADASSMICARVFWLSLSPTEVNGIFDKVKAAKDTNVAPMPELPEALVDAAHLYCQAQTICFSGQTVHVVSGRSQSYVSGLTPVVGSNSVGYQPTISNAPSGVTVQLKPQLLPNGAAVVDLASMVSESGVPVKQTGMIGLAPTTQPDVSSPAVPAVDTVNVVQQEFHTTVRLPLGKKILVGGMTLEPAAKDQAGRQLFLVIEVDAVQ